VWPIDPLVPRNLRLEVPEKLPQGLDARKNHLHPVNLSPESRRVSSALFQNNNSIRLSKRSSETAQMSNFHTGGNPRRNTGPPTSNQPLPLPPGESSFSYVPSSAVASSDPIGSSSPGQYGPSETTDDISTRDILRLDMSSGDPRLARQVLDRLETDRVAGWCEEVSLVPSKKGGYVQVSWGGVNKFAVLQEVVLWAQRQEKINQNDHVSHRCANPRCKTVGHMVVESAEKNNKRKNCLVHIACPHCDKRIMVCNHSPVCIKYAGPRFVDMDDFLQGGGICGVSCE